MLITSFLTFEIDVTRGIYGNLQGCWGNVNGGDMPSKPGPIIGCEGAGYLIQMGIMKSISGTLL